MILDMDVNYLLHRQQISLIRAQTARSAEGRTAYEGLAQGYTERIDAYRQENRRSKR
jgi:preprotein translocase subunit SecA